jgi:CheY-like chemotaxis protein
MHVSSPFITQSPRKYRVLAVDDNEIHCYALHKLLASAGFEVSSAHSGPEALKLFQQAKPDAVVLDIGMKEMNGFEVCETIRADEGNEQVAIVFHSASGHASPSTHSNSSDGADAFLTYPVDPEHLVSVVKGCIQRRIDARGTAPGAGENKP